MIRISVCMATYNGEKYIKEQLESIINQLSYNDEIIISDDNSSDKTIEIIESFKDERIKIFYNSNDKGYTNNFANALSKASGEYIFLSDQDDIWSDDKVSLTLSSLQKYDFVISDAETVDSTLNVINTSRIQQFKIKNGFVKNLVKTRYLGCCMAFKRNVLLELFPFPKKTDYCPHDLWIALISEYKFKCGIIKKPLIKYRRHNENVSSGGFMSKRSYKQQIFGRIYCLYSVLFHESKKSKIARS